MSEIAIGKAVGSFTATTTGPGEVKLSALKGRPVVLFFYPRANTPGCTKEAQDFRDLHGELAAAGAVVLGASRDSLKAQENFKAKLGLPFELIADPDEALCRRFDVIREKNMYGRKVLGIERSTFVIDARGRLAAEWRKVKVKGHAAEVLEVVRGL